MRGLLSEVSRDAGLDVESRPGTAGGHKVAGEVRSGPTASRLSVPGAAAKLPCRAPGLRGKPYAKFCSLFAKVVIPLADSGRRLESPGEDLRRTSPTPTTTRDPLFVFCFV